VIQERRSDFTCALLVGAEPVSRLVVLDVFRDAGWRLYLARDRKRALEYLEKQPVQVVVTNAEVPNWPWKKALQDLQRMSRPPQLIVSSRLADESLWAEVLNWGAYDLLAEPFQRDEVQRVIASARRHFDPPVQRALRAQAAAS
jgi:DNA-binding response OmpR family regulator